MKFEYNEKDYMNLENALELARQVCRPDVYQSRQNDLILELADFLLKPYHDEQKRKRK